MNTAKQITFNGMDLLQLDYDNMTAYQNGLIWIWYHTKELKDLAPIKNDSCQLIMVLVENQIFIYYTDRTCIVDSLHEIHRYYYQFLGYDTIQVELV